MASGPLGIEIVSHARRGREIQALEAAGKGVVENRIDDNVHRMQVPADDGPDLGGVAPLIPMFGVVS